jgi:hypothetical protein
MAIVDVNYLSWLSGLSTGLVVNYNDKNQPLELWMVDESNASEFLMATLLLPHCRHYKALYKL